MIYTVLFKKIQSYLNLKKKIHLTEISIKLDAISYRIYPHCLCYTIAIMNCMRVISVVTLAKSRSRMMRQWPRRWRAVVKTSKKEEMIKRLYGSAGLYRQPAHTLRWRGGSACRRPRWSWPPTRSGRDSPGAWSSSSLCAPCAQWSCTLHCLRPPSLCFTLFRFLSSRCALS